MEPTPNPIPNPEPQTPTADSAQRPMAVVYPQQTQTIINGKIINAVPAPGTAGTPKPRRRLSRKALLLPVLAVLVLLGGGAAAYFGYYVPNKPENILAKSLSNSLSEHQFTTEGTFNITSGGVSGKVDYTALTDEDIHAEDVKLNATISGVNIPLEIMSAKGNIYFKVGDLSSLEGLANQFVGGSSSSADIKNLEDKINKGITNQWINIDSTLIKEAKLDCLSNFPATFSQADIQSLKTSYKNTQFASITSHSADSVNGGSAIRYDLKINDDVLAKFNPSTAPFFKNLNSCLNNASPGSKLDLSFLKDGDTTPVTIWVDKSTKQIVKYASQSTSKDKTNGVSGMVSGTISYGKVTITVPANSKPVLSLLNEFGLSDLVSIYNNSASSTEKIAADTERKTDINALQAQLEAYQTTNGYYPTLASLNDPKWQAANMPGLDSTALMDPAGTSSTLTAQPVKDSYAYTVKPANCDNGTHGNCTSYTLTATLSDGTTYVKQTIN